MSATKSSLRTEDFNLATHNHGKIGVRVLKVRRQSNGKHTISEWTVQSKLWGPLYKRVFTNGDNSELVATDTQKNTVYVIAKRSKATTPEEFGIDICKHYMKEYPVLTAVEITVKELPWTRAIIDGKEHDHAFTHPGKETPVARVLIEREGMKLTVTSAIESMIILKTTQSGFENYLKDRYTLLPECNDRNLSTELTAVWNYTSSNVDYPKVREIVRTQILKGLFGPSKDGVFSPSLQATIYDAGCMVLSAGPAVKSINIDTPNIHYIPMKDLDRLTEKFENDIFIPTSEPSGSINCTVSRDDTTPIYSKL
jgi:urate oxidase